MYNSLFLVVQILDAWQNLANDQFGLFFLYVFIFFQIVVQVWSWTQFQNRAKAIVVNLHCVVVFHHSPIVKFLVDFVLSQCMLYVIILNLVLPTIVERVNFTRDFSTHFNIKRFVNFRKPSFTKDW